MAVATRNDRFSLVLLALPFGRVFPNPDGLISDADRPHWVFLYRGISLIAATLMALERGVMRRIHGRIWGRVN